LIAAKGPTASTIIVIIIALTATVTIALTATTTIAWYCSVVCTNKP
jgi:hypothetical protein